MRILSFELTMPNVGSWNGHWTGEDNKYYIIRKLDNKIADKVMTDAKSQPLYEGVFIRKYVGETTPRKNFYYNFGDGWGANVRVEVVDAKESRKRQKISKGFSGYDWMVTSIIQHGDILTERQIKELKEAEK